MELQDWLSKAIWPIEDKLTKEDIYFASKLGCIEMIKSGTTTFNDMYFFEEETARAVDETGIRANLGRAIVFDGEEADKRLKEAENLYKRCNGTAEGRIRINLPPHAPYTCNKETLGKCVEMAQKYKMQIHIHLSETAKENEDIIKQNGQTPTEYLNECGIFNVPCILAHAVYLNEKDIKIIKKANAGIIHNPISNLKLASGIADIIKYRQEKIKVGLGTDGAGSTNSLDMFEEMRACSLLQKISYKKASVINAYTILKMATIEGAEVLGLQDQIILNLNKPHLQPLHNIYSTLVYSCTGQDVETTIVDGKILMENQKLHIDDEEQIIKKCNEIKVKYMI